MSNVSDSFRDTVSSAMLSETLEQLEATLKTIQLLATADWPGVVPAKLQKAGESIALAHSELKAVWRQCDPVFRSIGAPPGGWR